MPQVENMLFIHITSCHLYSASGCSPNVKSVQTDRITLTSVTCINTPENRFTHKNTSLSAVLFFFLTTHLPSALLTQKVHVKNTLFLHLHSLLLLLLSPSRYLIGVQSCLFDSALSGSDGWPSMGTIKENNYC